MTESTKVRIAYGSVILCLAISVAWLLAIVLDEAFIIDTLQQSVASLLHQKMTLGNR